MQSPERKGFDKLSLTLRSRCQAELVEALLKRKNVCQCPKLNDIELGIRNYFCVTVVQENKFHERQETIMSYCTFMKVNAHNEYRT